MHRARPPSQDVAMNLDTRFQETLAIFEGFLIDAHRNPAECMTVSEREQTVTLRLDPARSGESPVLSVDLEELLRAAAPLQVAVWLWNEYQRKGG
jgi:hypothetical protein